VALLYTILEGDVTPYTCIASYGDTLYVSLLGAEGPLIVAYRVANNTIVKIAQYLIGDYRLFGMTHDGVEHLYYIHEYNELYGAVYRLTLQQDLSRFYPSSYIQDLKVLEIGLFTITSTSYMLEEMALVNYM
jgi:hypothetical protein